MPDLSPRHTSFNALRELTLSGFCFKGSLDSVWPEFPQLTKLRLEHCLFSSDEDLTEILPRAGTKLKHLEIFETRHAFRNNEFELPAFLADELEELWIENCWPFYFESSLQCYTSLKSIHVDMPLLPNVAPFVPSNLRKISVAVPVSVAHSAPDYARLEASLQDLSTKLPLLESVIVSGDNKYPLLENALNLEENLRLQDVNLTVEHLVRDDCSDTGEWVHVSLSIQISLSTDDPVTKSNRLVDCIKNIVVPASAREIEEWDKYIIY